MAEVPCFFCGKMIDPHGLGTYRRLVGWVKMRERGGTNSLSLASPPLAHACNSCIQSRRLKGADWDGTEQNSLF